MQVTLICRYARVQVRLHKLRNTRRSRDANQRNDERAGAYSVRRNLRRSRAQAEAWQWGSLPVCQDMCVIAMITDRDIAMRGLADDWRVDQVTVWEVMSAQIIPCFEDDSVE